MKLHKETCAVALMALVITAAATYGIWYLFGVKGLVNFLVGDLILTLIMAIVIDRSGYEKHL